MDEMILNVNVSVDGKPPVDGLLVQTVNFDIIKSYGKEVDSNWEMVDAAGHYHAYNRSNETRFLSYKRYPTLREMIRNHDHEYCDDGCCINDICEDLYQETYYQCLICQEEITPGAATVNTVVREPRSASWKLEIAPSPQFIVNSEVSVRMFIDTANGQWFGVACVTDALIEHGMAGYTLVGISDLGTTKASVP